MRPDAALEPEVEHTPIPQEGDDAAHDRDGEGVLTPTITPSRR